MKIAVCGSEPASGRYTPFVNKAWLEWKEGIHAKLPHSQPEGDWEIWGCSPGFWAGASRASRWFEVHRWEPGQIWFSPEYCQFLRDFKGPVYTGASVPEIPNHVVYPIDRMEAEFSAYFFTSSLALMLALAISEIEQRRAERRATAAAGGKPEDTDADDIIGLWGVDMAAGEEYGYQRPGCQFFVLEALRRGIAVYIPPESDLMRPMPIYGISEWDHNYIKLTAKARRLSELMQIAGAQVEKERATLQTVQGEMGALQTFVNTWTSPYGMPAGIIIRQIPGTGLGSGVTHVDSRPVGRMGMGAEPAPTAPPEPPKPE